jgi:hypothetical protein
MDSPDPLQRGVFYVFIRILTAVAHIPPNAPDELLRKFSAGFKYEIVRVHSSMQPRSL